MKKFYNEFKTFISRGSVIDMAVGIIIGGAFTSIVNSLVQDIFMRFFTWLTGKMNLNSLTLPPGNENGLLIGNFIAAIINFLLIALVVFFLVKAINKLRQLSSPQEETKITEKECPFCKSSISIEAVRCPHCTSHLTEADKTPEPPAYQVSRRKTTP